MFLMHKTKIKNKLAILETKKEKGKTEKKKQNVTVWRKFNHESPPCHDCVVGKSLEQLVDREHQGFRQWKGDASSARQSVSERTSCTGAARAVLHIGENVGIMPAMLVQQRNQGVLFRSRGLGR